MKIKIIPPHLLHQNPHQTRSDVSVAKIHDLVQSIRSNGQDEPIEIYKDQQGKWTILEGHRRVIACASLGRSVRCRVVPKPHDQDIMLMIWRRNTLRNNHTPSGVIISYIYNRVKSAEMKHYKVTLKDCALELGLSYEKVRQCYAWYKKLVKLSPQAASRCISEKWSEGEIKVALGLPNQRQHTGKSPMRGSARPQEVIMHVDEQGHTWMSCKMPADCDPELISEYFHGRGWPDFDIRIEGHTRMRKVHDRHESEVRRRLEKSD